MTEDKIRRLVAMDEQQQGSIEDKNEKEAKSELMHCGVSDDAIHAVECSVALKRHLAVEGGRVSCPPKSVRAALAGLELLMSMRCHNIVNEAHSKASSNNDNNNNYDDDHNHHHNRFELLQMKTVESNKTSSLTKSDARRRRAPVVCTAVPMQLQHRHQHLLLLHIAVVLFVHLILIVQGLTTNIPTTTSVANRLMSPNIDIVNSSSPSSARFNRSSTLSPPASYAGQDNELLSDGRGTSHSDDDAMALSRRHQDYRHTVPFYLATDDDDNDGEQLKFKSIDSVSGDDSNNHSGAKKVEDSARQNSPKARLGQEHEANKRTLDLLAKVKLTAAKRQSAKSVGGAGGGDQSVKVDARWKNDVKAVVGMTKLGKNLVDGQKVAANGTAAQSLSLKGQKFNTFGRDQQQQQQQQQLSIARQVLASGQRLNHSSELVLETTKNVLQKINRLGESLPMSADYDLGFEVNNIDNNSSNSNTDNNGFYNEQQQQAVPSVGQYGQVAVDQEKLSPAISGDNNYFSAEDTTDKGTSGGGQLGDSQLSAQFNQWAPDSSSTSSSSTLMAPMSLSSLASAPSSNGDNVVGQTTSFTPSDSPPAAHDYVGTLEIDSEKSISKASQQKQAQHNGGPSMAALEFGKNWNTFEPIVGGQTRTRSEATAAVAPSDSVDSIQMPAAAKMTTMTGTSDHKKRRSISDIVGSSSSRAPAHMVSSISTNKAGDRFTGMTGPIASTFHKSTKSSGQQSGNAQKLDSQGSGQLARYSKQLNRAIESPSSASDYESESAQNDASGRGPSEDNHRVAPGKELSGASSASPLETSFGAGPIFNQRQQPLETRDQTMTSNDINGGKSGSDNLTTQARAHYATASSSIEATSGGGGGGGKAGSKQFSPVKAKKVLHLANGNQNDKIRGSGETMAEDDNQPSRMFASQFRYMRPAKKVANRKKKEEKHLESQEGTTFETRTIDHVSAVSGRDRIQPNSKDLQVMQQQHRVNNIANQSKDLIGGEQLGSSATRSDNSGKRSARFVSNARLVQLNNQTSANQVQLNAINPVHSAANGKSPSSGHMSTVHHQSSRSNQTSTNSGEHQSSNHNGNGASNKQATSTAASANRSSISIGKPLDGSLSPPPSELKTTKKRDAWNASPASKFNRDQLSQASLIRPLVQPAPGPGTRLHVPSFASSLLSSASNKFSSKQDLGMPQFSLGSLTSLGVPISSNSLIDQGSSSGSSSSSNNNNNYSSAQIIHLPLANYISYPQLTSRPGGGDSSLGQAYAQPPGSTSSDNIRLAAYSLSQLQPTATSGSNNMDGQQLASDTSIVRSGFILPELHNRLHPHHQHNQQQSSTGLWSSSSLSSIPLQSLRALVPAAMALLTQAQGGSSGAGGGSTESGGLPSAKQLNALNQLRSLLAGHTHHHQQQKQQQQQQQSQQQQQLDQQQVSAGASSGDTAGEAVASGLLDHSTVMQQQHQTASSPMIPASSASTSDQMLATPNQLGVSHLGPGLMRDYSDHRPTLLSNGMATTGSGGGSSSSSGSGGGGAGAAGPSSSSSLPAASGGTGGGHSNGGGPGDQQGPVGVLASHMELGGGSQAPTVASSERSEDQRYILSNPYPSEYMSGGRGGPNGPHHQHEPSYSYYESAAPSRAAGPPANSSSSGSSSYYYGSAPAASSSHDDHPPHQHYHTHHHDSSRASDAYLLRPEHKSAGGDGDGLASGSSSLDPFEDLTGPLAASEYERDLSDLDEEFNRHTVFRPTRPSSSLSSGSGGGSGVASGAGGGIPPAGGHYSSDSMLSYSPERYESSVRANYAARRPTTTLASYLAGDIGYGPGPSSATASGAEYLSASGSISSLVPRPYGQHHYHHHHQPRVQASSVPLTSYDPADSIWADSSWDYSPLGSLLGGTGHYATASPSNYPGVSYKWRPRYTLAAAHQRISPYAAASIASPILSASSAIGTASSAGSGGGLAEQPAYSLIPSYSNPYAAYSGYQAAMPTETVSFTMSPLAAAAAAAATALAAADKSRHHHNHHAWTFTVPRLASTLAAAQQLAASGGSIFGAAPSSSSSSPTSSSSGSSSSSSSGSSSMLAGSQPQASSTSALVSPPQHTLYYRPATATAPASSYILSPVPIYAIAPRPAASVPLAAPASPGATAAASTLGTPSLLPYAFHPAAGGAPIIAYRPATSLFASASPLLTTASFAYPLRLPLGGPYAFQHPHYYHHHPSQHLQTSASSLRSSSSGSSTSGSSSSSSPSSSASSQSVSSSPSSSSSRLTGASGAISGLRPFFADLQFAESKSKPNGGGGGADSSSSSSGSSGSGVGKGLVVKSANNLTQMARNLTKKMFGSASQARPQFVAPPTTYYEMLTSASGNGINHQAAHASHGGQSTTSTAANTGGAGPIRSHGAPIVVHRSMSVH